MAVLSSKNSHLSRFYVNYSYNTARRITNSKVSINTLFTNITKTLEFCTSKANVAMLPTPAL